MDNSQNNWHAYNPDGNQAQTPTRRPARPPVPRPRIYACPQCDRAFDRPSALQQHTLTHTGERPHMCQLCRQRRFATASNLYRHMRTCRAPPPQSDMPETEESSENTDEETLNSAAAGSTINQIIPVDRSAPATPPGVYDRQVTQSANPDQMFERPLSFPSDPSLAAHYYGNATQPPRSSSTGWIGRDLHAEDQQLYIPNHAYPAPTGPLPQTYAPRVDTQQPHPISPTYTEPAYVSPNVEQTNPPYPAPHYEPYPPSGIVPVQSYVRAETFSPQAVPYSYNQTAGPSQIPYSTQHQQQLYSGEQHEQQLTEQQQQTLQNGTHEEGWHGPNGTGRGVHYYHQSG